MSTCTICACIIISSIISFSAIPGLIFAVNQGVIEYNNLTESSLQNFFAILEDNSPLLNLNGTANITGVYTTCTYCTYRMAPNYETHNGCRLAVA